MPDRPADDVLHHRLEERLRLAQRAGEVGVFDWDLASQELVWTDELRALIGVSADVVPSRESWMSAMHPDDRERGEREWDTVVALRRPSYVQEYRIVRRTDGAVRHVEVRAELSYLADGTPRRLVGTVHDVTDEHEAREALARRERRMRRLFDAAAAGIAEVDLGGRFTYVNRAFCTLAGRDAATLLGGLTVGDITHPDDRTHAVEELDRVLRDGGSSEIEKRYVRPDGTIAWVALQRAALHDDDGRIVGAIATATDITERRRLDESRAAQERERAEAARVAERLRLALGAMRALTYEQALDGSGAASVSGEVEAITGWTPAEIAAMPQRWLSLVHPEDLEGSMGRFEALLRDGTAETMAAEYRVRHRDGRWRHVWDNLRIVRDGAGRPLRVVGCTIDVTDRKEAEALLAEREATLRAFFDANVIGMVFGDIHGRFYSGNDELLRILGRTAAEMGSGAVDWVAITPPEWLPADEAAIAEARATGACTPYEKEYLRPDGTRVPVLVGYALLGEERERSVAFVLDLTPTKRAVAALRASEAQARASERRAEAALVEAQAANAAKDQFLAVLSHELRTPLAPVLLVSSMLLRRDDLPAPVRDQLALVRRNVELEVKLIDDLLDLTRIVRGKLELEPQPVDVHDQVREALRMVDGDAAAQGITLAFEPAAAPVRVAADPARLQQVLWNLVRNAVKFTPRGGRVTVSVTRAADSVAIAVRDTGIGIAPARLPRLFVAFEQGGSEVTRRFGGLGLGLAISRAIAEQHGGTLVAESEGEGRGATFTLALPLQAGLPRPPLPLHDEATPALAPLRILLVEDHADTGVAVAALLAERGHTVTTAGDLATARGALHVAPFDAIISDLGLPDGSGTALLAALQRDPPLHGVPPAIAMSGFGMEADVARSLAAGFVTHLVKPVTATALERALAQAMQGTATA